MDANLKKLLDTCRTSIVDAKQNPENDWKLFTVSNITKDGLPNSRYVVLRDANFTEKAEITFYTDSRSGKFEEFQKSPHASLCFFDRHVGLQLVMNASVSLYNQDKTAEDYWQKTPWRSLQCYYMKEKPGETLKTPFFLNPNELSEDQAYQFFTVVKCTIHSWDILLLTKTGNERASCEFNSHGEFKKAAWIAP